jgi:fucose permease
MSVQTHPSLTREQIVRWRNGVFIIFLLPGIAVASWTSRLPTVRDALDIRIDQISVLILGAAIGSIIGLSASSFVVARFGTQKTLAVTLVTLAAGVATTGIGATVPNFALTLAGLLLFGASAGITGVAMNVSGAENERSLGRSVMPIFHAFFSIGTLLGAAIGALAESIQLPISFHLGGVALVMVVAGLLTVPSLRSEHATNDTSEEKGVAHESGGWRERLSIWTDPRTIFIALIALAAASTEGTANDWLTLAMVDGYGVSNATGALVFGVFLTAMTVGRLGGVLLLDRFGRVIMLRTSFLLASAGLMVVIFVENPLVATFGVILWGLGSSLGLPIAMSAAADDPRTAVARVSAVATIGYFASLALPPLIGFLGEQVGLLDALLVIVALAAIGFVVAGNARAPASR